MPGENEYTLQDLADLTGVTPRTVRYYIAQGLLSAPEGAGPAARYSEGHLARLRLIRQLQREHLPLAEIRARLEGLDDLAIKELAAATPARLSASESAVDYIRALLAGPEPEPEAEWEVHAISTAMAAPSLLMRIDASLVERDLAQAPPPKAAAQTPAPDRSQWDRIALAPDIELHIRRPLSRIQNKRVERLIAIARQLLEEDQS